MSIHLHPLPSSICLGFVESKTGLGDVDGVFRRGKKGLFTARLQVPTQFQATVGKPEVWQATGTAVYDEAVQLRLTCKRQKLAEWNAILAGVQSPTVQSRYQVAAELASSKGFKYRPVTEFRPDELDDAIGRLLSLDKQKEAPGSVVASAIMGLTDTPRRTLLEMAKEMPDLFSGEIASKTDAQSSVWKAKWNRVAKRMVDHLGEDRAIDDLREEDAMGLVADLQKLVDVRMLTADSANKDIAFLNRMIREHHKKLKRPKPVNIFAGLVGVALQEPAAVSGEELQRMFLAAAGGVVEQNDGWADTAMTTVVGHDGPEEAALGGLAARVQHRRAGLVDKNAVRAAQMSLHVIDDGHQVETGTADPVAKRAPVQIDPLPLEDLGLAVKWQVVTELGHDDPGDEQFRGQPAGHDMLGCVRLRHGLRAAAAGIFGPPRDQHPELRGDHVQPFGHVLADLRNLAAAAGAERAGRFDYPLDPGQMRRQMPTVAFRLAGLLTARPLHRSFSLLLRGLEHTLGQLGIFQRQVELVGRQLLGALAELLTLRRA